MVAAVLRVALALVVVALLCPLLPYVRASESAAAGFLALAGFTVRATLFAGVPMLLLFCWRGWFRWWHFGIGGAVIGAVCVVPFAAGGPLLVLALLPSFVGIGAAHGLAFWLLGIWRNARVTRLGADPVSGTQRERRCRTRAG